MHRSKARLQAKIESMFCIQSPSCLNTSHQHCCNSRWKDLVVNNAVEILPGCREISVRRNQCLRKFMCLQKQGKVLFPKKSIKLFCSGRAGFVRGCPRARKSLCGSPQHSKKHFYIKEALALTVYAARRHVCYNLSSPVEYATIPKLRFIRSRTAHMDL